MLVQRALFESIGLEGGYFKHHKIRKLAVKGPGHLKQRSCKVLRCLQKIPALMTMFSASVSSRCDVTHVRITLYFGLKGYAPSVDF
jgi:hypothetical protein